MLKLTVLENSFSSLWLQPQHHKQQLINHGDETGGDGVVLLCTNTRSGKIRCSRHRAHWLRIPAHRESHTEPSSSVTNPRSQGTGKLWNKAACLKSPKKVCLYLPGGIQDWLEGHFLKHNHEAVGSGCGCLTEQFTDLTHQNTPIQTLENLKGLKSIHTLCRTCSKRIHLSGQQRLALKYIKCYNHDLMEASIWREENGFLQINYIRKTDYL